MNNVCVITFIYPGSKKKFIKFFNSLNNQSDKNFDLVIFLNNTKNFNYKYNNFKTHIFKMNKSIIESRFEMIKKIKKLNYKFLIFQDIDDTMKFNRIQICKRLLKKHDIVINDINIYNKKITKNYFGKRIKNNSLITYSNILDYNFVGMSNTSINKKCINKVKIPINKKIQIFDWYLWTIILLKFRGIFTKSTSTNYFVNEKSPTCLPTKYRVNISRKIEKVREIHKKAINKILKKKIIKTHINKFTNIKKSKKYNFWWEEFA